MGGYIGARSGTLSTTVANVQDVTATDTTPEVTIINNTHEDSDLGREGKVIFKGQQSGGEESTLAEIEANHSGSADDEKGQLVFRTNDGSDGASPTERIRIDSDGAILTATLGTDNVHLGEGAGAAIVSGGNNNVAIGKDAGTAITTGDGNVAVGYQSLDANTTADNNTAIGISALGANTTGSPNTAVGSSALTNNTTASQNVGVGTNAGFSTTTGGENTCVGWHSGYSNTTSTANTYLGRNAGGATTGAQNTFVGTSSGGLVTSGAKNSILGMYNGNQNGLDIRTSSNNIVLSDGDGRPLGYRSGSDGTWYFDNAAGAQSAITARNTGTGGFPYGININYPNAAPNNDSGRFFTCSDSSAIRLKIFNNGNVVNQNNSYGVDSDIKLKENIVDAPSQWDDIKAVTVRKYSLKSDNLDEPNMLGVVAQELETAGMNGLVNETADIDKDLNDLGTTTKSVKTSILYMKAVKALQEAMTRIETLEAQNTTQATQIADLITRVTALEAE